MTSFDRGPGLYWKRKIVAAPCFGSERQPTLGEIQVRSNYSFVMYGACTEYYVRRVCVRLPQTYCTSIFDSASHDRTKSYVIIRSADNDEILVPGPRLPSDPESDSRTGNKPTFWYPVPWFVLGCWSPVGALHNFRREGGDNSRRLS